MSLANSTGNVTVTPISVAVGTAATVNTTGIYHTGTVNAASHTTGTTGTGTGGISANVTTLFIGNNTINTFISTGGITVNNNANINFRTVNASAVVSMRQQSDDNFVFYSTNTAYGARAIWSVFANSATSALVVSSDVSASANMYFNSGFGSAGLAYGCRAWVRYNGSAQTITGSGGVTSVTYTAVGNYLVNLSFTMPDTNYSIQLGHCALNATQPGNDGGLRVALSASTGNWIGTPDQSTTSFRLRFGTTGSTFADTSYVSAAAFR
jgi:hypothetical protein